MSKPATTGAATAGAVAFLGSRLAKFRPWRTPDGRSPQLDYMKAAGTHPNRIFRSGNRCGKTSVGVVDRLLHAQGWHPFDPRPTPNIGWVCLLDWNQVGGVVWPIMKPWIDPSTVKIGWLRKSGIEIPESLTFANGSQIIFKSCEAGREKFQGKSLQWAWVDEETDQVIVEEVRARLLDQGGLFSATLTPVSRKLWVRDLERETYEGKPATAIIRASMADAAAAGILNKSAVDRFLSTLPERQRLVRELGDYAAVEGLVYPDFARSTHVLTPRNGQLCDGSGRGVYPWPLPASWRRFAAIDFGYANPTAVVVAAEDPFKHRLIVERVYYGKGLTAHRWGEFLAKAIPEETSVVADHDAFQRAELAACGVETAPAQKHVVPGIEAVDRAMHLRGDGYPGLMLVVYDEKDEPPQCEITGTRCDAHVLAWELEGYRYAERKDTDKKDPKDDPVKRDDHACDSLRYAVMNYAGSRTGDAPDLASVAPPVNIFAGVTPPAPSLVTADVP